MKLSFQIRLHVVKTVALTFIIYSVGLFNTAHSQTTYQTSGPGKIKIQGTSNIHDWEMNTDKAATVRLFLLLMPMALSTH